MRDSTGEDCTLTADRLGDCGNYVCDSGLCQNLDDNLNPMGLEGAGEAMERRMALTEDEDPRGEGGVLGKRGRVRM